MPLTLSDGSVIELADWRFVRPDYCERLHSRLVPDEAAEPIPPGFVWPTSYEGAEVRVPPALIEAWAVALHDAYMAHVTKDGVNAERTRKVAHCLRTDEQTVLARIIVE